MVAKISADAASIVCTVPGSLVPADTIALIIVAPEIALEPDMSGVCSCDGIFEISSNPRNPASINTKLSANVFMIFNDTNFYIFARNFILTCRYSSFAAYLSTAGTGH